MIKNNVLVLMSTYNGEKYLKCQIDSILNQSKVFPYLLIRDDGSNDNTLNILKEYAKHKHIKYYVGDNLGPSGSFIDLLFNVEKFGFMDFEYYAFADQDDYWLEEKLFTATSALNISAKPSIYFCSTEVVDSNLEKIQGNHFSEDNHYSLGSVLLGVAPPGCTMVFNKYLFNVLIKYKSRQLRMHDHWVLLTCLGFKGTVIEDRRKLILYRQHSNNVVGGNTNIREKIHRYYSSFFNSKNERLNQAIEFLEAYRFDLPEDSRELLEKLCNYKKSIKNKRIVLTAKEFKINSRKNMLFCISILFNKF